MTRITGLIGYPVDHSLSPTIHQYWMEKHSIASAYKLFTTAPARLRQTMLHMRKKDVLGVNVTVPHKETVMQYLDGVDDLARRIGAVNTVMEKDGKLYGTNTDAYGFIANLRDRLGGELPDLSNVVLFGAGGAARAAIVALKDAGATRITIQNRTDEKAAALAREFDVDSSPWDIRGEQLVSATLVVNTTILGMKNQPQLSVSLQHLSASAVVADIVYNPLETAFLKAARTRGNPTVDGLGMLLYQAQGAFAIWHDVEPAVDAALRAHVIAAMHARGDA